MIIMCTRDELIELCEKSIVKESEWLNRDSASSQQQVGKLWALLKAGCEFKVESEDPGSIRVEVWFDGFMTFEGSGDLNKPAKRNGIPFICQLKND
jgi:hypothetical protein